MNEGSIDLKFIDIIFSVDAKRFCCSFPSF